MRLSATFLSLLILGCAAQPPAPKGLALEPVVLPGYDSERGIQWAASRADYDAARADARYSMEQFTYGSDGLTVGAYLYRARRPAAGRQPVIVFNRGSVVRPTGFAGEMLVMAHRFAVAGFIVVAPQLRGSNGWAGRDELGGADLHDVLNVVAVLPRIPNADAARVFLAGESRGGAMSYMALRDGFPARAAAVWGGFTDLEALMVAKPELARAGKSIWPDFDTRRDEILRTRSAIRWADRLGAPVLIMHGSEDGDIPVEQSRRLDAELTRLGKVHAFRVFEGQQHVIGGEGAARDAATIAWFQRFGAAAVPPD